MILVYELKEKIAKSGYTQDDFATAIGLDPLDFSKKLDAGILGTDEIQSIVKKLDLSHPEKIFFV